MRLAGAPRSTVGTTLTFTEPNGTYPYSVAAASGFGPTPANGTIVLHGAPVAVTVAYSRVFVLTFTESNLPAGTNWSVTLTGSSSSVILVRPLSGAGSSLTKYSDGAATIQFYVSNGSYTYSSAAPGHANTTGSVDVSGTTPTPVPLSFPSSSSGPPVLTYAIIGLVVLVVAVVVAVALMRIRGKAPPAPPAPPAASEPAPPPPSA